MVAESKYLIVDYGNGLSVRYCGDDKEFKSGSLFTLNYPGRIVHSLDEQCRKPFVPLFCASFHITFVPF